MKKAGSMMGLILILTGVFAFSSVSIARAETTADTKETVVALNAQNPESAKKADSKRGHKKGRRHHQKKNTDGLPATTTTN